VQPGTSRGGNLTHNLAMEAPYLAMEAQLTPLLPLYQRERAAGRAFALAVVVHTNGSTYRKPGALMAIAGDSSYAGLLSGGCLETDLSEHARAVIATGIARTVTYNTGGSDDALWGLGVGCEGAMQILLLRVGPQEDWQPVAHLAHSLSRYEPTAIAVAVESRTPGLPMGHALLPNGAARTGSARDRHAPRGHERGGLGPERGREQHEREQHEREEPDSELAPQVQALLGRVARSGRSSWLESSTLRLFALPLALPPRLLLLGGGPDAAPIVELASRLTWKVTVYDHRPAYAQATHFPAADHVVLGRPDALSQTLDLGAYEAAVVMSHHLPSDLEYLRALATSPIGYVGLLGPPHRREKLLEDLGAASEELRRRLRAPVGLDLGGRNPESIALSIVAEIQAYLHGRAGPGIK
jgi:xanthine dehydrogenase accessory factor